jgi:uncharacterized membrane protein required for colicin V production
MVELSFVFYMFVFIFAIIGGMRGWAKEVLVGFSVILALFVLTVLYRYLGFVNEFLGSDSALKFYVDSIIVIVLAFFGYETPRLERFKAVVRREKIQDILLGIVFGGVNGYLIVGSIWYFLDQAGYFFSFVTAPETDAARRLIANLPPDFMLLEPPILYFSVAVAFTCVMIVFV